MTESPRHLLVIATQCESMEHLDLLEAAARHLTEAFLEPESGGCVPGLPDGRALFLGPLDPAAIRCIFSQALEHARGQDATLVLALLGHGFTLDAAPTLFYMAWTSQYGVADSAIDVAVLLRDAVVHPCIEGVVAVIDTCHAGAALPESRSLVAADKRLGVIMASKASQSASNLRLSRQLSALLRSGLDNGETRIRLDAAATHLQRNIRGQTIGSSVYNGDHLTADPLWLAVNRRGTVRLVADVMGPLGRACLDAARSAYPAGADRPDGLWDDRRLSEVRQALLSRARSREDERLLGVLTKADAAAKTVALLRTLSELTTYRLRSALTALLAAEDQLSSTGSLAMDIADVVDYVVFNHPVADVTHRRWAARFVGLVADENPELDDNRVRKWAESIGAEIQLADAREFVRARNRERQLRLVVSLHSWAGDWPEEVQTWLLLNGELPAAGDDDFRNRFACPSVDKTGAEHALAQAVAWARSAAQRQGLALRYVDVAAPAALLVTWRPEETFVDGEWLGVNHKVLTHWSPRFDPPQAAMNQTADIALRRLEKVETAVSGRLAWLAAHQTREPETLRSRMAVGSYQRGIGVEHRLGPESVRLLDILCSYAPIVLWWCHPRDCLPLAERSRVEEFWSELPAGFLKAYRSRWSGDGIEYLADFLADFRALWDDREWLIFCKKLAGT